jgi:filamentous hemagglutinin family protein
MRARAKVAQLLAVLAFLGAFRSAANPAGMTVVSGAATASSTGPNLSVNVTSPNAVLNWNSFNIGAGQTTTFLQPSAASIVWNRVTDPNPSHIFGSLNANGVVVLQNQAGFYFGPNSLVKTASLVLTTSAAPPPNLDGAGAWQFNSMPPAASIINYGQINVANGGSLFLIAEKVDNHGVLSAPDGTIGLYAGKSALLNTRPDGRGFGAEVTLPGGSIDNAGQIVADGGSIALQAKVVNQDGLIQANSVRSRNGEIEFVAEESVNLGANSNIQAVGDNGASSGGSVSIRSSGTFSDVASSEINVSGGSQSGNGGQVEISAPQMSGIASTISAQAAPGYKGGVLSIDPANIQIGSTEGSALGSGSVGYGDPPNTLVLNVNTSFLGFSRIDLQASQDITLGNNVTWSLASSTGVSTPGTLTLEAGHNITLGSGASISGDGGWGINLIAGEVFPGQGTGGTKVTLPGAGSFNLQPGVGTITVTGANNAASSGIETDTGNINLAAGQNITVGTGYIRTIQGGNINANALAGSVNSGTDPNGYQFSGFAPGYAISSQGVGGISTSGGGDVNISAGLDIVSFLPPPASFTAFEGGLGAYGFAPGNVNLSAGRNVTGHFVINDGSGVITAANDAGVQGGLLSLSLATGGWIVNAGQDVNLQEVRNPLGTFNSSRGFGNNVFNYSPGASVTLDAGNAVNLLGQNLPRLHSGVPPIVYPPILNIDAGAGGVNIENSIILAPSPEGNLAISTTGGGNLSGLLNTTVSLVMSDSASTSYATLASAHAPTPLHLNDPTPAELNISGNIENLFLTVPKETDITAAGTLLNFSFNGQNLRSSDTTAINAGDIFNRAPQTYEPVAGALNFSVLDSALLTQDVQLNLPLEKTISDLLGSLSYNAQSGQLVFLGKMNQAEVNYLLSPQQVEELLPNGHPVIGQNGQPVYLPVSFTTDPAAIQALYTATQDVPGFIPSGILLGGPGLLAIKSGNVDLGATGGIQAVGPLVNPNLGKLSLTGANIVLDISGDLSMAASRIATFNDSDITIIAGGAIDVGSQSVITGSDVPKGIYTSGGGNVSIQAGGNVNVDGSRVATYDGGNITINSSGGDVNAGTGGLGYVAVNKITVNPLTGAPTTQTLTIPGSGILATALPGSPSHVGDITIATPRGDIIADSGGIIQLPFNSSDPAVGNISLRAGGGTDPNGTTHVGSIDTANSGVIGANINLNANGPISGLVVARNDITIVSDKAVSVTAFAQGGVSISGSSVSGTVVGGGNVDVSAATISAALISANVSASGNTAGAVLGAQTTAVAGNASQGTAANANQVAAKATAETANDDDLKKKPKGQSPVFAKSVGRVTVILPNTPN